MEYNSLMQNYFKSKQPDKVLALVEEMKTNNISPDVSTYTIFLNHYSSSNNYTQALQFFESVKHQFTPDIVFYSTLLRIYLKTDQLQKGLLLYEEMKQNKVTPDIILYTMLAELFGKLNRPDEAKLLFGSRFEVASHLRDERFYVSLIEMYARLFPKHVQRSLEEMKRVRRRGVSTYLGLFQQTALIQLFISMGQPNHAIRLFEDIKQQDIKPDVVVYHILIDMFAKSSQRTKALALFVEMKRNGMHTTKVPSAHTPQAFVPMSLFSIR